MDTILHPKKKKKESELGLAKQSRGNIGKNTDDLDPDDDGVIVIDGVEYKMGEDLKNLPEIDYDDPKVKKWMEEEEAERVKKYGKPTSEEIEAIYQRSEELQRENPKLSTRAAFDQAHHEIYVVKRRLHNSSRL